MRTKWPENGALRQRSGFLKVPLTIDGEARWMERAEWVETCSYYGPRGSAEVTYYKWCPIAWGKVEDYVAQRDEWKYGVFSSSSTEDDERR